MKLEFEKKEYPDGTFYPVVNQLVAASAFAQDLTFRINSYNDLWFLAQIKDVLDHNGAEYHLTIPCLLDAQADRRFNANEPHSLKLVCDFINRMNWKSVSVFHPHNAEVVEALIENVRIIDNTDFVNKVLIKLRKAWLEADVNKHLNDLEALDEMIENHTILMSTDAGGFKPLMKLAKNLKWKGETESAAKSRRWDSEKEESILEQRLDRQDFGGKDILIVDDICVKGGTYIGLAEKLRQRNIGDLYLAISHMTVEYPNPDLFKSFDKIFTTNSKGFERYWRLHKQNIIMAENVEVIKMFEDMPKKG